MVPADPEPYLDEVEATLCVVISFYDRRTTERLRNLLASIARFDPGARFVVRVVVNKTSDEALLLGQTPFPVAVVHRENVGMNIGAWDRGWREEPRYRTFLFLQDECVIVRDNWAKAFIQRCEDPGVGLVGETLNASWDKPWERLRALHWGSKLPDHFVDGRPAERVDAYLHAMKSWGVDPGISGAHLRSIVWAARRTVLEKIGGFPIGANYGECIAAEIAASRKCASAGLRVVQVSEEPFCYIRHFEWAQEAPGGAFYHSRKQMPDARWDLDERYTLDRQAARLSEILDSFPTPKGPLDQSLIVAALACRLADCEAQLNALRQLTSASSVEAKPQS